MDRVILTKEILIDAWFDHVEQILDDNKKVPELEEQLLMWKNLRSMDTKSLIDLSAKNKQLQRDYSHLLRQKQDCTIGLHNLHEESKQLKEAADQWAVQFRDAYKEIDNLKEQVARELKDNNELGITSMKYFKFKEKIKVWYESNKMFIPSDQTVIMENMLKENT